MYDKPRMYCERRDWGDRFTQPLQHLDEVTEYFHSIGGVPRWLQDGLNLSYEEVCIATRRGTGARLSKQQAQEGAYQGTRKRGLAVMP